MSVEMAGNPIKARHDISLMMVHPSMHPDVIADALNWDPRVSWLVGEQRRSISGELLEGVRNKSYWCNSEREEGGDFFNHLVEILEFLEERRTFVVDFVRSSGEVTLCVQLPGDCAASSRLTPDHLRRLAALGVELSLEAFPEMR